MTRAQVVAKIFELGLRQTVLANHVIGKFAHIRELPLARGMIHQRHNADAVIRSEFFKLPHQGF